MFGRCSFEKPGEGDGEAAFVREPPGFQGSQPRRLSRRGEAGRIVPGGGGNEPARPPRGEAEPGRSAWPPAGAGVGDPQLSRGSPLAFCALWGLALALRPQQLQEPVQGIRAPGD